MIAVALQILLAYLLADAGAAVYHFVTDRGWNIASQVADFQKHHRDPLTMTFDLQPLLVGVPLVIAGVCGCWPAFTIALGLFVGFAQVPHYYAHFPAPRPIRWLQACGLLLPPAAHERHHGGDFNRDFCVVSGWNNWWINWLAKRI